MSFGIVVIEMEKKCEDNGAVLSSGQSTIIIGAGFYGLSIALYLYEKLGVRDIVLLEKEDATMTRASYVNQARVHNGYHYPRSILTAYRSAVNFPVFTEQFKAAVVADFDKYYGIARNLSKVNAHQFVNFCQKIGVGIQPAPPDIEGFFNHNLVEAVYKVKEYAFDAHKLRDDLLQQIARYPEIKVRTGVRVDTIKGNDTSTIDVETSDGTLTANYVLNCTYANINTLHRRAGLPLVGLKHEITEMCLVKLPKGMEKFSITLMDGPFFSVMPFPSKGLYTLSHVRYTPHESWLDNEGTPVEKQDTHHYLASRHFSTNYKQMYNDVIRFIPALRDMQYVESIVEVKTVLVKSEDDDSRPILFKAHHGIRNYVCIMGGKLDNIYDVFEELEGLYDRKARAK